MEYFQVFLYLAAFLCTLVAGFLFAFLFVIMPGIKRLNDREFVRSFQVIDRVIQDGQPVFMTVWLGSIITLLLALVLGVMVLDLAGNVLIVTATLIYIFGVQLPTFTINVPLNNKIQLVDVDVADDNRLKKARHDFESRWNLANSLRTILACCVSALLMYMLLVVS